MKSLKELLNEKVNEITLYHGDNYNTTKIDPKRMLVHNSNNQEGVGIYFGSLDVAKDYGKNIVFCTVDKTKFWESRTSVEDVRELKNKLPKLLSELHKIDNESFFYLASDYIELMVPEDVEDYHFAKLAGNMNTEQIRYLQVTLVESFGVEDFVKVWNKIFPRNLGTYEKESQFYAIIDPKIKITKYKE